MNDRLTIALKRVPTIKGLPALALAALAFGTIMVGCVQDHDPRDDSSRIDAQPRSLPVLSHVHVPA